MTAKIAFDPNDGKTTELEYSFYAGFPRTANGVCAYCEGDPCAESGNADTRISAFYRMNPWAQTCPMCFGVPS